MVEVNDQTGVASDPWRSIGRSIADATTIEQAIRIADLDWEVELDEPVFVASKRRVIEIPGFAATVRTSPERIGLAVVSSKYTPIQNRDALGALQKLVDEEGLRFDRAGEQQRGRRVFLGAVATRPMRIAGAEVDRRYVVLTSHDATQALFLNLYLTRRSDGISIALDFLDARRFFRVVHTGDATARARSAAKAVPQFRDHVQKVVEWAEQRNREPLDERGFDALFREAFDFKPKQMEEALGIAVGLFRNGPQTRWGAYCAVVGWLDHHRGVKASSTHDSRGKSGIDIKQELRAIRILERSNDRDKFRFADVLSP